MRALLTVTAVLSLLILQPIVAFAKSPTYQAAEQILAQFGVRFGGKILAIEIVERQLVRLTARFGDDALRFSRALGHRGIQILDSTTDDAGRKILSFYEKTGVKALTIIDNPKTLDLFIKHGDEAADAMMKHPGLATDVIGQYGLKGARVLNKLDNADAVRFTKLLVDDPILSKGERASKFAEIIENYGNPAMHFIWENKGALAISATAAAFLQEPEPFINGTKSLVTEPLKPIVESVSWNWVVLPMAVILFLAYGGVTLIWRIRRAWSINAQVNQHSSSDARSSPESALK